MKHIKEACRAVKYLVILVRIILKVSRIRFMKKNKKVIFFIATPIYGNLGDYAIVYAQYMFMREIGLEENIVELNSREYHYLKQYIKKIVAENDIIIIDGGGNIGTLWIDEEYKIRDIITRFNKNPIFIFPQTAFFESSDYGRRELEKSKEIYNSHKKLTVFCRDEDTYDLFKKEFGNASAIYTPDIVLYIEYSKQISMSREGVLVCFRDDKEQVLTGLNKEKIYSYLAQMELPLKETSTVVDFGITKRSRFKILERKFDEFISARFVLTDRLHGMLFCAITGTPCLAVDNVSHKVKNGYKWIQYLPYIIYCDNESEIITSIDELVRISTQAYIYSKKPIEAFYDSVQEAVKNEFYQDV